MRLIDYLFRNKTRENSVPENPKDLKERRRKELLGIFDFYAKSWDGRAPSVYAYGSPQEQMDYLLHGRIPERHSILDIL